MKSLREKQTTRERFEDVLFLIERDEGMASIYAMAQALAEKLTEAQLMEILQESGWEPATA